MAVGQETVIDSNIEHGGPQGPKGGPQGPKVGPQQPKGRSQGPILKSFGPIRPYTLTSRALVGWALVGPLGPLGITGRLWAQRGVGGRRPWKSTYSWGILDIQYPPYLATQVSTNLATQVSVRFEVLGVEEKTLEINISRRQPHLTIDWNQYDSPRKFL